ncbi:MAG: PrgI family protein [Oscillospiraceae bacterium]|nr:PrgI family protein [Oscillospiraceae bacterium]
MAFVNVPKDLNKIKNKALFNLTVRQLVCFGAAAAIGIPVYILTRVAIGGTGAALLMIGLMLPCFFFAMFEKDGQPAEKVLRNYIRTRIYFPGKRPYKTENLYEILEKEGKSLAEQETAATPDAAGSIGKRNQSYK